MKWILFVCIGNAARSQMAEAFARHFGKGKVIAASGGIQPREEIDPKTIEVMAEKGVSMEHMKPKAVDWKFAERADVIVSMGCGADEFCPAPLLPKAVDWKIEDPKGGDLDAFRRVRDDIERRVIELLGKLGA